MNRLNTQYFDEEWIELNNFYVEVQIRAREKEYQSLMELKFDSELIHINIEETDNVRED